jgi:hypothetical protein
MALPANTGYLDLDQGIVFPNSTGEWSDYTSWDSFTSWTGTPADPLIWVSDIVDLGEVRSFCLKIITEAQGEVSYDVYISTTGAFDGEETLTSIAHGATGVASFTARWFAVAVKVAATSGVNILNGFEITATEQTITFDYNSLDTSTLSGTSADRTLTLKRVVSQVVDLQITPQAVTAYNLDVYVTNTPTSTTVIPRIISKGTSTVNFALVGVDNQPRDALVDIKVTATPEQYMQGNNLLVR